MKGVKKHPLGAPGYWRMRDGTLVRIKDMTPRHKKNTLAMIERFIDRETWRSVDKEDEEIIDPLRLLSLDPWHKKKKELEKSLGPGGTKEDVIESAKDANDHCVDSNEMIEVGDGVQRAIKEDVNA